MYHAHRASYPKLLENTIVAIDFDIFVTFVMNNFLRHLLDKNEILIMPRNFCKLSRFVDKCVS